MKYRVFFVIFFTLWGLQACSNENKSHQPQIITIQENTSPHVLFYSGVIQPLHTVVIPSPADGVVIEMPFQYGQLVKSGQLLFKISSTKFLTDYKAALTQYIKAKNDLNTTQAQLNEAKFLHNNQLIADDDYKMKESSYYAARLGLLQSKDALEVLLKQLDVKSINLYDLTIANIEKINQAMHFQMTSENLRILAPGAGIILAPHKTEDSKRTMKGDAVKQGDVLAVIGDMDGVSVRIKVNELIVNQLQEGQAVKITGIAFPEFILNGKIRRVDRQGENTTNGMPTFNVEVIVTKLSQDEKQAIHAGMSANVEIAIKENAKINVPINAIIEKNGKAFISVWNDKTNKVNDVRVQTGRTTTNSIAILAGLNVGDKIVIPN